MDDKIIEKTYSKKNEKTWKVYSLYRTNENWIYYQNFERMLADKIKEDPKSFYSYIRSKQKVKQKVGPIIDENGNTINSEKETAEALNCVFPTGIYKGE